MPKAIDKRKAELSPDPIAAIVADDRARGRRPYHPVNFQRAGGGEDRRGDEDGLARHGNAGAFQSNDQEDREIAVSRDDVLQVRDKFHVTATP